MDHCYILDQWKKILNWILMIDSGTVTNKYGTRNGKRQILVALIISKQTRRQKRLKIICIVPNKIDRSKKCLVQYWITGNISSRLFSRLDWIQFWNTTSWVIAIILDETLCLVLDQLIIEAIINWKWWNWSLQVIVRQKLGFWRHQPIAIYRI